VGKVAEIVERVRSFGRARSPKVRDLVSHEGAFGKKGDQDGAYRIVDFPERAVIADGEPKRVRFVRFENRRYSVLAMADELVWLEEDTAWMLPGRLLSAEQKKEWMKLLGAKYPPPPEKHVEARAFLRSQGAIE
jgi:hypothetical protein